MIRKHGSSTLFISISLILLSICVFIGCLFLYFHSNDAASKNATIIFSSSDDSSLLTMDSSMPVTDAIGKQLSFTPNQTKHGYSEFSISSNMEGMDEIKYEIYAKNIGVSTEIATNYVKLYLTDADTDQPVEGFNQKVPTYRDLKVAVSNPAGKKIYTGVLKKGETKNFRLRMWLADTYPITEEVRSFGILLYVKVIN